MKKLDTGVVAELRYVEGNFLGLAELAKVLEMYNYRQAPDDERRWDLESSDPADKGAGVRLAEDGRTMEVFTMSAENIENLHYASSRAGWTALKAICATPAVKELIEAQFVQVEALCEVVDSNGEASSPLVALAVSSVQPNSQDAPAEHHATLPIAPSGSEQELATDWPPLEADSGLVSELAAQLKVAEAAREAAEQRRSDAEERCAAAVSQVTALTAQLSGLQHRSPAHPSVDVDGLLRVLEKHVLGRLMQGENGQIEMLADLRSMGLDVALKLVPSIR